jgi:biopolymer transport protein ExbD
MADVTTFYKAGKRSLPKFIRVDLTPMVDLGFLLITFFVLTTSLQELKVAKLILPKDTGPETPVGESTTLTFILKSNDSIGYYEGILSAIKYDNFGAMKKIILYKQQQLTHHNINKKDLSIIVKPTKESSYKNFIDALDEITISDCRHYFIADPDNEELALN